MRAHVVFKPSSIRSRSLGILAPSKRIAVNRIAVLYQACDPPAVDGVRKPRKPTGYRDSGADIAYVLRENGHHVVTEFDAPNPLQDEGWCFPDTEKGILSAIQKGATHLWANTVLFGTHPLQGSEALDKHARKLRVIGQPPLLVDEHDDKNFVNSLLRTDGRFLLPESRILNSADPSCTFGLTYPVVGKPIRGRGSHGVKVCRNEAELTAHVEALLKESALVMVESYLPGEEGTVTVMPPSKEHPHYWALPIIVRFNHKEGIAPYNGVVAVTQNSRVLSEDELKLNPTYADICKQCEQVAELLQVTAPIRIDVRRVSKDPKSPFAMFDINMKPNMTGPGRPGREDQASLTAMAAQNLGWDYARLLVHILNSAQTLEHLRNVYIK
jgi:D-alanine-D-alanine ligase-like ATP-grasp enzyme